MHIGNAFMRLTFRAETEWKSLGKELLLLVQSCKGPGP